MTGPLFPASTLDHLRAMNEANLPHTCQRYRNTSGYGPGGVVTAGWAAHEAPVECRATPSGVTAAERSRADQVEGVATYTVVFPAGTDVLEADRLVVTGQDPDGSAWELRLEVLGVAGPRANEVMRKAACEVGRFDPATM